MSVWLHGIHDEGGENLHGNRPGWTLRTEAIGSDPNNHGGYDLTPLTSRGITPIVRLNNAYGEGGTFPPPAFYGDFAKRCANYVASSPGCQVVIIGNEPNHFNERPKIGGDRPMILPSQAADVFNQAYDAIKRVAPNVKVLTPPVAPWDATTVYPGNERGDWVKYAVDMWDRIVAADGVALHAYTHGAGVHLITSSARMDGNFRDRHFEFRAYRDFIEAIPAKFRGLPAYITETDQVDAWVDANTHWVEAAYDEIDRWNKMPGTQKVRALLLYRWPDEIARKTGADRWGIEAKPGVQVDFVAAVNRGFLSPQENAPPSPQTGNKDKTYMPSIEGGTEPPTTPTEPPVWANTYPPAKIDSRAYAYGVRVEGSGAKPGQWFWRITEIQYATEAEAGGRRHVYADVREVGGKRFTGVDGLLVEWPGDSFVVPMEAKPGEPWGANKPLTPGKNAFSISVKDEYPSERATGIGMGEDGPGGFNPGAHTWTAVIFELSKMNEVVAPKPAPTTPPTSPQKPAIVPALAFPVLSTLYRRITQEYGVNGDYYSRFKVDGVPLRGHNGVDFGTPVGTVIVAVDGGRVVEVANDPTGYGLYVKISHVWGETLYAHLQGANVIVNERVTKGEQIGASGNSGNSTGPHLHFGMRVAPFNRADGMGGYIDPLPYLGATDSPKPAPTEPAVGIPAILRQAAAEFGVQPLLFGSLAMAESSHDPMKFNEDSGALGLLQITPPTWEEWSANVGVSDAFDARSNARVGAAYFAYLMRKYPNSERTALWAWNWGLGNVDRGGKPPAETIEFATKVLHGRDVARAMGA